MHPTKALDMDGMHTLMYKKCWNFMGDDVGNFVRRLWRGNMCLKEVNKTNIILIPKVKEPKFIT